MNFDLYINEWNTVYPLPLMTVRFALSVPQVLVQRLAPVLFFKILFNFILCALVLFVCLFSKAREGVL